MYWRNGQTSDDKSRWVVSDETFLTKFDARNWILAHMSNENMGWKSELNKAYFIVEQNPKEIIVDYWGRPTLFHMVEEVKAIKEVKTFIKDNNDVG